jgi:hypothetical protein
MSDKDDNESVTDILREGRGNHNLVEIQCHNCGTMIPPDATIIQCKWWSYDGQGPPTGSGFVSYCDECVPPGIPRPK